MKNVQYCHLLMTVLHLPSACQIGVFISFPTNKICSSGNTCALLGGRRTRSRILCCSKYVQASKYSVTVAVRRDIYQNFFDPYAVLLSLVLCKCSKKLAILRSAKSSSHTPSMPNYLSRRGGGVEQKNGA